MDNNRFHDNLSYLSSSYSIKLNAIHWYSTTHMCISYNVQMHTTVYISTYAKYVYIWYMKENETKSVSHSVVPDSVTPWAVAIQAPLSMELSRQEYWSGCHSLLQGIPDPEIKPDLLHCRQILYHLSHQGSPIWYISDIFIYSHG